MCEFWYPYVWNSINKKKWSICLIQNLINIKFLAVLHCESDRRFKATIFDKIGQNWSKIKIKNVTGEVLGVELGARSLVLVLPV
jgi:hypothetical protein